MLLRPMITALPPLRKNPEKNARGHRAGSCRDALLAVAAVDRAGADELPAVAVMGRLARRAEDAGDDDRLAADLADRGPGVVERRGAGGDDRDAFVELGGHTLTEAVV